MNKKRQASDPIKTYLGVLKKNTVKRPTRWMDTNSSLDMFKTLLALIAIVLFVVTFFKEICI